MSERTSGPWKWHSCVEDLHGNGPIQIGSIYAEPTIGHAYSVAVAPKYQTEARWKADAAAIVKWENSHDALVSALEHVRSIIADGAMTGFNHKDGDWANHLFFSQQITSAALEKAKS
jgi:hypothetical protein